MKTDNRGRQFFKGSKMKTDKSFEARFEVNWEKQRKKERETFRKRVILLFLTLFPFSLILGFIFVL